MNTAGDGFIASFPSPSAAIACADALIDAIRVLGIEIRVGIHAGEVEVRGGDDEVAGMAVHIGARVAALAGPSEVLVSSTVRDIVTGSRHRFADRGEHALKGVPGTGACALSNGRTRPSGSSAKTLAAHVIMHRNSMRDDADTHAHDGPDRPEVPGAHGYRDRQPDAEHQQ